MLTCVRELADNPLSLFLSASAVLLRCADNVLRHPSDPKYRRLRVGSAPVTQHLLPVPGALQCLFAVGFTEAGEYLTLPLDQSLATLMQLRAELAEERRRLGGDTGEDRPMMEQGVGASQPITSGQSIQGQPMSTVQPLYQAAASPPMAASASVQPMARLPGPQPVMQPTMTQPIERPAGPQPMGAAGHPPIREALPSAALLVSEAEFGQRVLSAVELARVYENPRLQAQARAVIPRSELMQRAHTRLAGALGGAGRALGGAGGAGGSEVYLRDAYVLELLAWFKSFFSWVDTLPCSRCGGRTASSGPLTPSSDDLRHGAARVEGHTCVGGSGGGCGGVERFPRYTDPGRLLETRRGRCGEWASAFTLCCRAEGLEARYILDWTDHVWTEVYSDARQRWVHCDPCENVSDQPLLYEQGWGKTLTYILAFSLDDVQDVTWRYVANHGAALARRGLCREGWLVGLIVRLRARLQRGLSAQRLNALRERIVAELVELLLEPRGGAEGGAGVLGGRTTGSLEWRLARRELGVPPTPFSPVIVRPSSEELRGGGGVFVLKYCCARDIYVRGGGGEVGTRGEVVEGGWRAFVYEAGEVERKEERDWGMVYLARAPSAPPGAEGRVSWRLDLGGTGRQADWVRVGVSSTCYQAGRVCWTLEGGRGGQEGDQRGQEEGRKRERVRVEVQEGVSEVREVRGCEWIQLTATLTPEGEQETPGGGQEGSTTWQHAQICRQSITALDVFPLCIELHTVCVTLTD